MSLLPGKYRSGYCQLIATEVLSYRMTMLHIAIYARQNAATDRNDTLESTMTLDDTDNRIIALLMDNARVPVATIARQLSIARTTAIARIAALEKRGVIAGYGVRMHAGAHEPAVGAYVGVTIDPRSSARFVAQLQKMPQVDMLCAVSGSVDYMLELSCRSTAELDRLLDQIGTTEGVRTTSTSIILTRRIDRSALPPNTTAPASLPSD
jgi:DNA-binding Lrp family transcriptional regulator